MAKRIDTTKKTLTPKQLDAIAALLSSESKEAAAKAARISKPTLYRYLAQAHFVAALKAAEKEALVDVSRQLAGLSGRAVTAISGVLDDDNASENARLRAAELILNSVLKLKSTVEFEERIAALERRADQADDDRRPAGGHLRAVN